MILESKQTKDFGNDCLIYKTTILYKAGQKYVVATISNYNSSWFSGVPDAKCIEEFENEAEAYKYYNET